MWKEVTTIEDMEKIALLRNQYGCSQNFTAEMIKNNLVRKIDCHYFYYESKNIELIKGYKLKDDIVTSITFTIKAEIVDYPESLRLMGEHTKLYLESRGRNILINLVDNQNLNDYNKGVSKIGVVEFLRIMVDEYRKLGIKVTFDNERLICELM